MIKVLKIEISDDKLNDSELNNSKFSKTSNNDKNDENFVINYYEETEEVSFEAEEAE